MKRDISFFWELFKATFALSAFTFGGGCVIVPLMREKFVNRYQWLQEEEMLNLTAIAQSAPGPLAVNASILVGFHLAGIPGAAITILGTILPPFLILSVISMIYTWFKSNLFISLLLRGMQAGVAAVVLDVTLSMAQCIVAEHQIRPIVIMSLALVATVFFHVNVIWVLLFSAGISVSDLLITRVKAWRVSLQ
jgi:chromate transporter